MPHTPKCCSNQWAVTYGIQIYTYLLILHTVVSVVSFKMSILFSNSFFIIHYCQLCIQCPGSDWDNCNNQLLGVTTYSKIGGKKDDDHQVVVKITEMTVPLSPPRRDSLIVIFTIEFVADYKYCSANFVLWATIEYYFLHYLYSLSMSRVYIFQISQSWYI